MMTHRWNFPAVAALAAAIALTSLTAEVLAKQERPAQAKEETARRNAGEPIMAIVSIKSQQVTFYDADGWVFRAPVSTGVEGDPAPINTPAPMVACIPVYHAAQTRRHRFRNEPPRQDAAMLPASDVLRAAWWPYSPNACLIWGKWAKADNVTFGEKSVSASCASLFSPE